MQNRSISDARLVQKRAKYRQADARALASGKATKAELQRKNSLIPEDFWYHEKVDWERLALE
jgi:hypothetical protein